MAQPPERASVSGYGGRISVRLAEDRGRLMRSLSARLRVTSGGRHGDHSVAGGKTVLARRGETAQEAGANVQRGDGRTSWGVGRGLQRWGEKEGDHSRDVIKLHRS